MPKHQMSTTLHQMLPDAKVIEAIQRRKELEAAVRYLYQTHYCTLASYVMNHGGNEQDAEEYFHEALVVFIEWVRQGKCRADSSIRMFLYAILRDLWCHELTRRTRDFRKEMPYYNSIDRAEKDLQEMLCRHESKRQLLPWLDQLGENDKKLLMLFYYEQMPVKDICREMGYESEQVVWNMKSKCMKKLNKLLGSEAVKVLLYPEAYP